MKHLFLIRHGDYDKSSGSLTEEGIRQIELTSAMMKEIVGEDYDSHRILSSSARRARESAKIIEKTFGQEHTSNYLPNLHTWSGKLSHDQYNLFDNLVRTNKDQNILTIVGHSELTDLYSKHFDNSRFEGSGRIKPPAKGEGVYFNIDSGTLKNLSRG